MHPGPMNRGVEIDPRVADAADALIETQVRAGLVIRMAVLYDLLTTGPVGVEARRADGGGVMLYGRNGRKDDLVVRGARVLDPAEGIDAVCDVRVDGGTIAQLGTSLDTNEPPRRRRRGPAARAGVRRPARAPAHARPRGRGDDRLRHRGRRGRRLLRDPRDAEHRAGRRLGRGARLADRGRAGARPRSRSASSPRSRAARRARS